MPEENAAREGPHEACFRGLILAQKNVPKLAKGGGKTLQRVVAKRPYGAPQICFSLCLVWIREKQTRRRRFFLRLSSGFAPFSRSKAL
jgi:hypothetical protein